ncbi:hypothetical protein [Gordonia aquimaris]|uniref:Uncharacterized protein n=1 Tax=Gordonia aquimaris TaxID=2984863 RepID=A0A9X3I5X5_9ACTN|nr:hypothetical protein [Gordonia aquimaris]MCX2966222.1 hypothetical protein [Gordonia aquimaris]
MWAYQFIAIGMLLAAVLLLVSASLLPYHRHLLRPLAGLLGILAVAVSVNGAAATFVSEKYGVAAAVLVAVAATLFSVAAVSVLGLFGVWSELEDLFGGRSFTLFTIVGVLVAGIVATFADSLIDGQRLRTVAYAVIYFSVIAGMLSAALWRRRRPGRRGPRHRPHTT